ncbi:condensation domain-containing protein [Streptomyces parvus]|uniref:condensation domain-containing protein n=1 Tax=Streptomyces parvus TaxID=66428 RepID=UPI00364FFB69
MRAAALGRALTALTRRHEILRTSYPEHEGRPVQQVLSEAAPVPLTAVRLDGESAEEAARRLAAGPFDLADRPPLLAHLLTGPDDEGAGPHSLDRTRSRPARDGEETPASRGPTSRASRTASGRSPRGVPSAAVMRADRGGAVAATARPDPPGRAIPVPRAAPAPAGSDEEPPAGDQVRQLGGSSHVGSAAMLSIRLLGRRSVQFCST